MALGVHGRSEGSRSPPSELDLFSFGFSCFLFCLILLCLTPFLFSFTFASRLRHKSSRQCFKPRQLLEAWGYSSRENNLKTEAWFKGMVHVELEVARSKGSRQWFGSSTRWSSKQWLEMVEGPDTYGARPPRGAMDSRGWSLSRQTTSRHKVNLSGFLYFCFFF